jgi:hypothetical protein
MGSEGVFLWVWIMEDEISEHSTNYCWVRFVGKMPASNILYNILWVQEDDRRARIVNPAEKNYGCSRDCARDFQVKDQRQSH